MGISIHYNYGETIWNHAFHFLLFRILALLAGKVELRAKEVLHILITANVIP